MRTAFASMVLNTGARSPGELEMTLEHIGCRGLLLQRLGEISVRWRSSLSRRVFSIAMTAWSANVVTSSICLSVNGRTSWR